VYLTNKNGRQELRVHSQAENWDRLIVASAAFGEPTVLSAPAASPDGQHVAFDVYGRRGASSGSIWITAVGGGPPIRLTPGNESEGSAVWSPDGQSIVCLHSENGENGLALRRVGASDPPRMLAHQAGGVIPAWSPNAEWIAYQTNEEVRLVSPDGARTRVLDTVNMGLERNTDRSWMSALVWSADSRTLYSIRRAEDRIMRLVAIDAATGTVRVAGTLDSDFTFSTPQDPGLRFTLGPDGRRFLATIGRSHTDLWILDNFAPRRGILDWFRRRGR
jgi:dipeptidyl aminopeptidase/acylaminoacyl peptidase